MTTDAAKLMPGGEVLCAYLLGSLPFEEWLHWQRRLVYDTGETPERGTVVLCEHPPTVTIGREGSHAHLGIPVEQLQRQQCPVHWVARGGGVMLHLPGQLACYPILRLDRLGLTPAAYVDQLAGLMLELLAEYELPVTIDRQRPGIVCRGRRIAHIGVAVRGAITAFGLILNVDPDLRLFYRVRCDGDPRPMTSLQRELGSRCRVSGVRQRLLERMQSRFGFARLSIFHQRPEAFSRNRSYVATFRH